MAVSCLLLQLRSLSVFPKMSLPFFVASVVMVLVRLSDSASVPMSTSSSPTITPNEDGTDALKLLASSKILMDHTSPAFSSLSREALKITGISANSIEKHDENGGSEGNVNILYSVSPSTYSTALPVQNKKFFEKFQHELEAGKQLIYSNGGKSESNLYEMSSPFHVARCRATCLQKLATGSTISGRRGETGEEEASSDEMHLLPLLRLRRSRTSKNSPISNENSASWSCQHDSVDCLECWKSCELFEPKDNRGNLGSPSTPSIDDFQKKIIAAATRKIVNPGGNVGDKDEKVKPATRNQVVCSSLNSVDCLTGCKVACSFYEELSQQTEEEQEKRAFKRDPVVATRHESVVQIVPGKITWPPSTSSLSAHEKDGFVAPVVYVVIQEYPDRKWRQISQTTDTSIGIPTGLTSEMSSKLRSVRVLVVGPSGLQSVYSPENNQEVGEGTMAETRNNFGKGSKATIASTSTTIQSHKQSNGDEVAGRINSESSDSTSTVIYNDHLETVPVDSKTLNPYHTTEQSVAAHTPILTPSMNKELHVEGPFSFELRIVSLIHQKSLVIAELKWDEIGGNPFQEYLITWELTGGGLKGHLVTDSTSVTLSLWPDTKYQIQVQQFLLNLDSDGEQSEKPSSTSMKSLPLIVDTNEASYPMEKPSALLGEGGGEEDEDEDEFEDEDVSPHDGDETVREVESHKSFTGGFLNMTLLLAIAISALIFVLVILTVAAFTWTKMRKVSAEHGFMGDSCTSPMITPTKTCEGKSKGYSSNVGPEQPLSQDDFYWEEYSPVYHSTTVPRTDFSQYASPFDLFGGPSLPTTVSVISTSSSSSSLAREAPSPYQGYSRGTWSNSLSSNMAYSLLSSNPAMLLPASSKLGCPSLGSSGGGFH